jgi:transposase
MTDTPSPCLPEFELQSERMEALPVINHFLKRLRLQDLLHRRLPAPDGRCKVPACTVLSVLLRNLVLGRAPLYSLSEWSAGIAPQALGLTRRQMQALNDDRIGRALDELFDADRQALLTEFVLGMIREFRIDLSRLHNDSTSLSLQGCYREGDGRTVRGQPTARIAFGYNKDHRPDLKQLLWILTVSSDGAVPVCFKVTDGSVEDSTTHIDTWNLLRQLTGRPDFLYIADSKLCTFEALGHIDRQGGGFLTPLPRSRKEDPLFREWLRSHCPDWREIGRRRRPGQPVDVIQALESPIAEAQGFRLLWFLSSRKLELDAAERQHALMRADRQLDLLKAKLQGPRCRFKQRNRVARAVQSILERTGTARWIDYQLEHKNETIYRQEKSKSKKRPIRLRSFMRSKFLLRWSPNLKTIHQDSRCDGISPLLTNRGDLSSWALYCAYHDHQTFLEQRHDLLKNTLQVTPAYLHSVSRLEAFLFLEYLALTVHALIERQIRRKMARRQIEHLPLYPEARKCKAPTAARIFAIFEHVQMHTLRAHGKPVQHFPPQLTPLQKQLLALLDVPIDCFSPGYR